MLKFELAHEKYAYSGTTPVHFDVLMYTNVSFSFESRTYAGPPEVERELAEVREPRADALRDGGRGVVVEAPAAQRQPQHAQRRLERARKRPPT